MFRTKDEIEHSMRNAGILASRAKELASKAKPCIWLETFTVDNENEIPIGSTKIGGAPDLPDDFVWPYRDPYPDASDRLAEMLSGIQRWSDQAKRNIRADFVPYFERRALTFIAQIDLGHISGIGEVDRDIPTNGRLYLFYDAELQPWGYRQTDHFGWKILFDASSRSTLRRIAPPYEFSEVRFDPLRCVGHPCMSIVPAMGYDYSEAYDNYSTTPPSDHMKFLDWQSTIVDWGWGDWNDHRVGGQPTQLQHDMQWECQMVSNGVNIGLAARDKDEVERLRDGIRHWLMLFQIASDEKNKMTWGGSGFLYVWIHRDDLRAKRFEKARVSLQCT